MGTPLGKPADAALRTRIERLMWGEFKVEDLTTIFLALRDRAGGRQSVVEIGDFVAHRDERNKGYVTRAVRDFFVRIPGNVEGLERPSSIFDLPPYIAEFLQASARRMDYSATQKRKNSFTRVSVDKALPGLLSCIHEDGNGRCFLWPAVSDEQVALFNFLAGHLTFKPLITEHSLIKELCGALIENALLGQTEVREFEQVRGAVALFALTHMHQCFVNLG